MWGESAGELGFPLSLPLGRWFLIVGTDCSTAPSFINLSTHFTDRYFLGICNVADTVLVAETKYEQIQMNPPALTSAHHQLRQMVRAPH